MFVNRLNELVLVAAIFSLSFLHHKVTAQPAGEPIELSAISCRELLLMDGQDEENTLLFMHGYMSGKNGDNSIDPIELANITDQIKASCVDDFEQSLLAVFEEFRGDS